MSQILSFLETKPNWDNIDYKHPLLENILHYPIETLQNLMVTGIHGCGKTVLIYSFLSSLLGTKDVYSIKSATYEEDRKEIQYRYSPYHVEFSPLDLSSYENIFIKGFLKEYVKSKNVSHNIPKIVIIKNAEYLSTNSNKALGIMLEKNIESARFIFECRTTTPFLESLRGRCVRIRVPYPSRLQIENSLERLVITHFERELLEEEKMKCFEYSEYFGNNMKHIYGILYTYLITGEWIKLSSITKIENLYEIVIDKNVKNGTFEQIRELVQELYIELAQLENIFEYITKKLVERYKNDRNIVIQIIELSSKYDVSMKKGNKLTIHLESFLIHLIEILHFT